MDTKNGWQESGGGKPVKVKSKNVHSAKGGRRSRSQNFPIARPAGVRSRSPRASDRAACELLSDWESYMSQPSRLRPEWSGYRLAREVERGSTDKRYHGHGEYLHSLGPSLLEWVNRDTPSVVVTTVSKMFFGDKWGERRPRVKKSLLRALKKLNSDCSQAPL